MRMSGGGEEKSFKKIRQKWHQVQEQRKWQLAVLTTKARQ